MDESTVDVPGGAVQVHELPGLGRELGIDPGRLLVLRDDLLPLAGGGNKVRKGAVIVADALRRGATTLVTSGAAQSNHVRAIAGLGIRAGLDVHLVLAGEAPSRAAGNVLLDELFGATIAWAGDGDLAAAARQRAAELETSGASVELVPFGGSSPTAVEAYASVGAALEGRVPDLRHVVVAVGSGATMAGLVVALGVERVLGVDCGAVPDASDVVARLVDAARPGTPLDALRIEAGQVGTGYADLQPATAEAIVRIARADGIVLDPTYTGRAAAGLVAAVGTGAIAGTETTLLVHSGGVPGLFGHPGVARADGSVLARPPEVRERPMRP